MAVLPVLYLLAMVSLLVVALRLMWFNVNQINKMLNNPVEVNPRLQHPELENVKNGDELMVVKFKPEIDAAIDKAVAEARRIDEESMAKHNRDATVLSMILGFTTLALFVDGLLRMLGIIPPFMHLDVNILDKIETDVIDKIKQVPIQKLFQHGFR